MTSPTLVGMPLPPSLLADGCWESALDRWQRDGGVDTILVRSAIPAGYAAAAHPQYYANTILRPLQSAQHHGDDLQVVLDAAAARGLSVFAMLTELSEPGLARRVPGWAEVLEVDVFGRRASDPCLRHPDYRNLWLGLVEDQVKSYPVDGLCVVVDRPTPFGGLLAAADGTDQRRRIAPVCFCVNCRAQADRQGIDLDRAQEGWRQLLEGLAPRVRGGENPAVVLFRILLRFPEVVAWESLWMAGYLGLQQQVYGIVKAIAPHISVGWQVPPQHASSPWYRALDPLTERVRWSDFLFQPTSRRPRVTADVLGVTAPTADAFAAAVLASHPFSTTEVSAPAADRRLRSYVGVEDPAEVTAELEAGADGVIYAETLAGGEASRQLSAAGKAVQTKRGEG